MAESDRNVVSAHSSELREQLVETTFHYMKDNFKDTPRGHLFAELTALEAITDTMLLAYAIYLDSMIPDEKEVKEKVRELSLFLYRRYGEDVPSE